MRLRNGTPATGLLGLTRPLGLSNPLALTRLLGLVAAVAIMTLLSGCNSKNDAANKIAQDIQFRADGVLDFINPDSAIVIRILIEVAETPAAQAQGLMYRRTMPDRGGMLFVDPVESMRSFWMKNTPLALDIMFVDADGQIVNIVKRTTPFSEDQIESTAPAQFVVEVRAGFVDRYGITEENRISWERRTFDQ